MILKRFKLTSFWTFYAVSDVDKFVFQATLRHVISTIVGHINMDLDWSPGTLYSLSRICKSVLLAFCNGTTISLHFHSFSWSGQQMRFPLGFPLGEFVRANRERSNLIGWWQTLTTSPANHIRFLLVCANQFAKWKNGLTLNCKILQRLVRQNLDRVRCLKSWYLSVSN